MKYIHLETWTTCLNACNKGGTSKRKLQIYLETTDKLLAFQRDVLPLRQAHYVTIICDQETEFP